MNFKKLLSAIGLLAVAAPTTLSVVACGPVEESKEFTKDIFEAKMDEYSKNNQLALNIEPGQVSQNQEIFNLFNNKIEELFKNDGYTMPSIKSMDMNSLPDEQELNEVTGQPWQSAEQNQWKIEFDDENLGEITFENLNYSINVRHNIEKVIADIPKFIENENKDHSVVLDHVFNYISEKTGLDITTNNHLGKYHIAINIGSSGLDSIFLTLKTEFENSSIGEGLITSDYFTGEVTKWYWIIAPTS